MKTEWKVIVSVVVILLCMEIGVRAFETRLSKDLAHLRELPAAAQRLKKSGDYKILIVGNSLARYAINQKMLARELESKGYGKVQVEAFYPDGTSVTEWNYGLRRYFLNAGAIPDRIILVTGRTHLLDAKVSPERLAAFYVDGTETREAISNELKSIENITRFFLARASSLFANRARIQPFVFYNYLPAYTQTIQEINDLRKSMAENIEGDSMIETTNLSRLLQVAQARQIAISVVAVPMRDAYESPRHISDELAKNKAVLWDLSGIKGIEDKNFFDGYHLDTDGAEKLTQALIDRIPSK